ncbi:hypothetical protein EG68_02119, partial [Paragonimus skrjabini miyazakii]
CRIILKENTIIVVLVQVDGLSGQIADCINCSNDHPSKICMTFAFTHHWYIDSSAFIVFLICCPIHPGFQKPEKRSNTFLWQVSTEPPSFLFGTLHVAYTQVWPQIDPAVKIFFANADSVYIELDLMDPNTLIQLGECQLLPPNVQLTELLAPSLIHRLELQLANFKKWINLWTEPRKRAYTNYLYATMTTGWKRKRPMWIFLLLNSLATEDFSSRGVPALDLFLTQEAQRLGKRCGAVEQVSDQCDPLNNVETEQVALALTLTLDRWEAYDRLLTHNWSTSGTPELKHLVSHLWTSTADGQLLTAKQRDYDSVFDKGTGQVNRHFARSLYEQWFLSPMNRLIEQYNCGYLDSLILPEQIVQLSSFTETEANFTHRSMAELETRSTNESESTPRLIQPHQLYQSLLNMTTAQKKTLSQLEVYLFEELILKRNMKMAKQISRRLKLAQASRQSAFFALGAGHFVGHNDTIIHHLQQQGYVITPIMRQPLHRSVKLSALGTGLFSEIKQRKTRNRLKEESSPDLPGEDEVPKFRPHHVKFNNAWILIELFNPT